METNYGHWDVSFVGDFNPEDWFGFIYFVKNNKTGNCYIGKKQFFTVVKKKIEGRKNRKHIKKPVKWQTYMTSSEYVKDAIKEYGKDSFSFEIVHLSKERGDLRYVENNLLHVTEALTRKFENGERVFYNAHIDDIKFIPKYPVPEKLKEYLDEQI